MSNGDLIERTALELIKLYRSGSALPRSHSLLGRQPSLSGSGVGGSGNPRLVARVAAEDDIADGVVA